MHLLAEVDGESFLGSDILWFIAVIIGILLIIFLVKRIF